MRFIDTFFFPQLILAWSTRRFAPSCLLRNKQCEQRSADCCQAQPQLQLSWAEMVFNVNLTPPTHPPTQPPTQPGKYQASKIKQFMLNGSCQSLGVKLKTVFGPNLNYLNSSLKAINDSKNGKLLFS